MTDTTNAGPVLPELSGQPRMHIALFDEHGNGADDRVLDYGRQCAEQAAGPLREQLAECFNLGGADADGNGTEWRAVHAVRSVRQLRQDYDEACDEAEALRADAERYRWLRDSDDLDAVDDVFSHTPGNQWNAAIDSARAAREVQS